MRARKGEIERVGESAAIDDLRKKRKRTDSGEGRLARKVPPAYQREDPYLQWFYQPHTITLLIITVLVLIYIAFNVDDSTRNPKFGLLGVIAVFLVFSVVQMKDGVFQRPHPVVWRMVTGLGILYLCLLVYLLFQSVDEARSLLKALDPSLGIPLPERSYAADCRIYTPDHPESLFYNIKSTIFDEFLLAHFFGWWLKTLMIRDVRICWTLSIAFELAELSLEHLLPNFKECWWDHIILDVLVCNALGIYMGMKTCRYLQVKEYNWAGVGTDEYKQKKFNRLAAIKRGVMENISPDYEQFDWNFLSTPKRFYSVFILFYLCLQIDLNAFFLKYVLWIPPPHYLNILRLALWVLIGTPSLREHYQFYTDPKCKRFGTMAWLGWATMGLELLVSIKYGKGMFPTPWPSSVVISWSAFFLCVVIWSVFYFGFYQKQKTLKSN